MMSDHPTGPGEARRGGLAEALAAARGELLADWAERAKRELAEGLLPSVELMDHMPAFLEELIEKAALPEKPLPPEPAGQHGIQRLRLGFNVGEVVREYGLLHESVVESMSRRGYVMTTADHLLVARTINSGIANAISQYVSQRDAELERQASEHLGFMAHELRNGLSTAMMAYQVVATDGPALERLGRSLRALVQVVDNTLTQSWLRMGVVPQAQPMHLRPFLEDLARDLDASARDRTVQLLLELPHDLVISGDPRLLRSAVSNLLGNGLKFSPPGATVTLRASTSEGRVLVEVADQCGGLPPGRAEELFSPLVQRHENRTGFGLGLAIVLQAAEAHGGTVKVRDVPGTGCVFTLDLPLVAAGPR